MIGKLLPVLLLLIGVGGGIGAGLALKPDPAETAMESVDENDGHEDAEKDAKQKKDVKHKKDDEHDPEAEKEYVKLNNQFLIPVVADELVESLVVMSVSLEILPGQSEAVYMREPKLRDAFLQVLFDHANIGGFRGEFTNARNLDILRSSLTEVAQTIMGDVVSGVLITDIARQDT